MPYREMGDPNAGAREVKNTALQQMRNHISAEEEPKFGVELAENINPGDVLPLFEAIIIEKTNDPRGIVLYSADTGILRFKNQIILKPNRKFSYTYENQDNKTLSLTILFDQAEPKSKKAIISTLTSKSSLENEKRRDLELRATELKAFFDKTGREVETTEAAISAGEEGFFPQNRDMITEKIYKTELGDLREKLKSLLATINEQLAEKDE